MLAYILSKQDLTIQDVLQVSEYNIVTKSEFDGRSIATLPRMPNFSQQMPFIVLKDDDNRVRCSGVLDSISGNDSETSKTAKINQMETLLDRKIELTGEELLSTGIEDFIKNAIEANFSASGDSLLDTSYLNVTAATHTPSSNIPDNDKGVYNLIDYLSTVLIDSGIFLKWEFSGANLNVTIKKKPQNLLAVDARTSDVSNYFETLNTNVTGKVKVLWNNNEEVTTKTYYLLSDMSITEDAGAEGRVVGNQTTIAVSSMSIDYVLERVQSEFNKNRYDHAFNADILAGSKLYPESELYVGHKCKIATRDSGIYDTVISSVSLSNTTNLISVKFGLLPVTLLEKIKEGK